MSEHDAMDCVDFIVEALHRMGIIPEHNYGTMTENQRQELAESLAAHTEE